MHQDLWQQLPTELTACIWRLRFRGMLEDRLERFTQQRYGDSRRPTSSRTTVRSQLLTTDVEDDWNATVAHQQLQVFYEFYEAWSSS